MPRLAKTLALSTVSLLLGACGRPASEAECDEIVGRIAQLELEKRQLSQEAIATEVAATKKALRETTMKDCVGTRITEGAMTCVREAKTSQEIVDGCFD